MVNPTWDYTKGLSSIPLIMVQFTRFKCGSVCMGVAMHHHIGDGIAYAYFISSWARLSRGLDLAVFPVHERSLIHHLAPRNPPQVKFRHLEFEPRLPPLSPNGCSSGDAAMNMEGLFSLSKPQINALKLKAASYKVVDQGYTLSTFEVVAGHVWRSACMARGLANEQQVKLYIPIDARTRLKDPTILLKGYYGNLVFFAACIAKVGDIVSKPLWYTASMIHETLVRMQDVEYLKSAVDYLELQSDPLVVLRGADSVTSPNLLINSWGRIPSCEADFGWGCPTFFGNGGVRYEGLAFLIPTTHGDGSFTLSINLYKIHMPLFEKYLYDFQSTPKV
ncbi:anthranilate N-benzoyltransferase protein 3-like [Chenopodium quinoa]|nr:anthranilate N-benzoyltransferase protein 3-like [Chenopodium quinoa]